MVSQIFQVSTTTIRRWLAGHQPTGKRRKKIEAAKECVAKIDAREAFASYARVQALVKEEIGLHLSFGSLFTLRKALGITRKRVMERKIYGSLERVESQRLAFREKMEECDLMNAIAVDECHFTMSVAPKDGYAPKGDRLLRQLPDGKNESYSLLCVAAPW